MKTKVLVLIFFVFSGVLYGQEYLVGLSSNVALRQLSVNDTPSDTKSSSSLALPFFDDFSNYYGYPNTDLWQNNQVFVNTSYAVFPPTVGVATFDALDEMGNLYSAATTSLFSADTLSSRPIRLDSLFSPYPKAITVADSIYLSFYFQPGGGYGNMWERIGNAPAVEDSLILEFYDYNSDRWNLVWATCGFDLDTLYAKTGLFFKYVNILIDSNIYFSSKFQFRFRNYCSLDKSAKPGIAANTDQWNIDYVYLNNGRSRYDTTTRDVAFVLPAQSFLKNYWAMPAKQFQASDMKSNINLTITNLYSADLECNYNYVVENTMGNVIETYSGGHDNISPFLPNGNYQTATAHANPPVGFSFPVSQHSPSTFTIKHIIKNGITGDLQSANDTIKFSQVFDNFYAYDDGVPENGYGITSSSSVMYLAYKFSLNTADTITAIDMFFNPTLNNENAEIPFYITIWADNNGEPGNVIYKSAAYSYPKFADSASYRRYLLDYGVKVNGTIYIGFEQRSKNFINLGFDRNNDARQFIYYKTSNEWQQSILLGALMMRPYFGAKAVVGISDLPEVQHKLLEAKIYPNPATQFVNIELENNQAEYSNLQTYIYDVYGRCVYQSAFAAVVDISNLAEGVYMLRVASSDLLLQYSTRIIVVK